jgi:integrase
MSTGSARDPSGRFTVQNLRGWAQKKRSIDEWETESTARGAGSLCARAPADRSLPVRFYYSLRIDGERILHPLGAFDPNGRRGLTLADARGEVERLEGVRKAQRTNPVRWEQEQREEQEREREQARLREAVEAEAARRQLEEHEKLGTLGQLMEAYARSLEQRGKTASARVVRAAVKRNIGKPFPELLTTKARDVTQEQLLGVLKAMVERKVTRDTNKVRSYLRAAFALGLRAESDPLASAASEYTFRLGGNAAADLAVVRDFNRARARVLTREELRLIWQASESATQPVRACIRIALASGGQRIEQLLRLRQMNVDLADGVMRLTDPKGRGEPRAHDVPINGLTREELLPLQRDMPEGFIFSHDAGKRPLHASNASRWVSELSTKQRETARQMSKPEPAAFRLSDVRRTCETMLAALGIDRDIRAHLLSHGRSGVQLRHYDRHSYMPEKRDALSKWDAELRGIVAPTAPTSGNVRSISTARRRRA